MKNTEGVPYGRGLEVPESSVLSVVLILLAIANIVTNKKLIQTTSTLKVKNKTSYSIMLKFSHLYNKKRRKDKLNKKIFLPLPDKPYCNNSNITKNN